MRPGPRILALTTFVVACCSGGFGIAAHAEEISNVARLSYVADGGQVFVDSNAAVIERLDQPTQMVSGYIFDVDDGQLIGGTRVDLLDGDSRALLQSVESTRAVRRSSKLSTAASRTGLFEFARVPPGRYQIEFHQIDGYEMVRGLPDIATSHRAPDGRALRTNGNMPSAEVLVVEGQDELIDVAMVNAERRVQPNITLEISTDRSQVEIGDPVRVSSTVANRSPDVIGLDLALTFALPRGLRLVPGSLLINGVTVDESQLDNAGSTLSISIGAMMPGSELLVSFVLEVGAGAKSGEAVLEGFASSHLGYRGLPGRTVLEISSPFGGDKFTLVGRVSEGGCDLPASDRAGVAGVRVVLDDGSFAVTDAQGLYHFEGLRSGLHVVQIDTESLGSEFAPALCRGSTRRAGSAISQFVDGVSGTIAKADFVVVSNPAIAVTPSTTGTLSASPELAASPEADAAEPRKDAVGGDLRILVENETPGVGWILPERDHNPAAPALHVAIKHAPGAAVSLTRNGKSVLETSFEGTLLSKSGAVAISHWRGVMLVEGANTLVATVAQPDGMTIRIDRTIGYANTPAQIELVPELSKLLADGANRPILALRFRDAAGNPVRDGVTGELSVAAPHILAEDHSAQSDRLRDGIRNFAPTYLIAGGDGVALVELEPTTSAGWVDLTINLRGAVARRPEAIRAWLSASREEWMLVGFAAGTAGFNTLSDSSEPLLDPDGDDVIYDGQASFYAKGRVLGKWLLTVAYDSEKDRDETQLFSGIDPDRYYSLYGDSSLSGYDASSSKKLYLRVDRDNFYAMFGDFETGFNDTELARYSRALTGLKIERVGRALTFSAFAAETAQRNVRDEIQGIGLSGPYRLSRADMIANTDRVRIEVRDRFRSERILETRALTRHIDYEIDPVAATLLFREPVLSRDSDFNPTYIVAEYETYSNADSELAAGGRVTASLFDERLTVGFTGVSDERDGATGDLVGADLEFKASKNTTIRLEGASGSAADADETSSALLAEIRRTTETMDVVAYVREIEGGFGLGQAPLGQDDTRKTGVDAQIKLDQAWSVAGTAYREDALTGSAVRGYGDVRLEHRSDDRTVFGGARVVTDDNPNLETRKTQAILAGVTQSLLDDKLDVTVSSEINVGEETDSVSFPTRHRVGANYAVTQSVQLVAAHEVAPGDEFYSQSTQVGFVVQPWTGARVTSMLNQAELSDLDARTFALFGLSQSMPIGDKWLLDASYDSGWTVSDASAATTTTLSPVAPGGLALEDFDAVTAGANYRSDVWSWNGRLEYRDAASHDRVGVITNVLRQLSDTTSLAGNVRAFSQTDATDTESALYETRIAAQHRPADGAWTVLDKLTLRHETQTAGALTIAGPRRKITGDARSTRLINNLVANYDDTYDGWIGGSIFYGAKYIFDRLETDEHEGYVDFLGGDLRADVRSGVDLGFQAGVLRTASTGQLAYVAGPSVGVSPTGNVWISVGYNVAGFRDRDFEESRYTRRGPYITFRIKFDQSLLSTFEEGPSS